MQYRPNIPVSYSIPANHYPYPPPSNGLVMSSIPMNVNMNYPQPRPAYNPPQPESSYRPQPNPFPSKPKPAYEMGEERNRLLNEAAKKCKLEYTTNSSGDRRETLQGGDE